MKQQLYVEHESEYDFPKEVVVAQLSQEADSRGYQFDSDRLTAKPSGVIARVLGIEHRFNLEYISDKERCRLNEEIYRSVYFEFPALTVPLLFIFSIYTTATELLFPAALAIVGSVIVYIYFVRKMGSFTIAIASEASHNWEKLTSIGSLYGPLLLIFSLISPVDLLGIGYHTLFVDVAAAFIVGASIYYIYSFYTDGEIITRTVNLSIRRIIPLVSLFYALTGFCFAALIVIGFTLQDHTSGLREEFSHPVAELVISLWELPFLLSAFLVVFLIYIISNQNFGYLKLNFDDRPDQIPDRKLRIAFAPIVIGFSYLILVSLGWFLLNFTDLWGISYILGAGASVTIIAGFYFILGLFYQAGAFVYQLRALLARSSSADLDISGCDVWVVDLGSEGGRWAASVSTWFNDYIFISEEAFDVLDDDELMAVVEHERSHIDCGEASLSFNLIWVSFLTFAGRNALFSLFDFNSREVRADRRAAEEAGVEALVGALEKLSSESGSSHLVGFSSFGGRFEVEGRVHERFEFLFGDYTMRRAHPPVDDRIRRVESWEDSGDGLDS